MSRVSGISPVRQRFVHDCSRGREFFGQNVTRLLRAHDKDALVFDASLFLEFAHYRFGYEFFRLKIDVQVKIFHALRRGRPDRSDAYSADFTGVIVKLEENIEERFDAVRAREHDPIVGVRILHQFRELAQVGRRLDPDRRQFDDVRAKGAEFIA